jgi:hypothetical protein
MRKRILLPLFTILIFFPFLVYVLSYTRLFNDEVGALITKIVDERTNARLYIGKIHGSILSSFRIDGAALIYNDKPIALVDTIRISHLPLSIITKTAEVLQCQLVNPRFYLVRFKDGTFNVDHIGKGHSKPGGNFDWFVVLKNLKIRGGEFVLYDSTKAPAFTPADQVHRFDASNFKLKNVDVLASADISADNLSASIKNISFTLDPSIVKMNSMKFDFLTSEAGTEVSGLDIKSDLMKFEGDVILTGQNLLDSIDLQSLRRKHIMANIDARDIDIRALERFLDLPVDPVSKVDMDCYASGNLDTLFVRRLSVRTASSFVPLSATFYNLIDSAMAMRIETRGALINSSELSAMLNHAGMPDISQAKPVLVNAAVNGTPRDLKVNAELKSGETNIVADANSHEGSYTGELKFNNIHLGELLNSKSLNITLTGGAGFTLRNSIASLPEGKIHVQIDSSSVEQASVQNGTVNISSASDSLDIDLRFLTSKGNFSGTATVDTRSESYSSDLSFSELDLSSFVGVPLMSGVSTGRVILSGSGFSVDSLDTKLLVFFDHSTLGGVPMNNSAFTLIADTKDPDKSLRLNSPFVDADISGDFVTDKLPSQLSNLFSALADGFSSKITGHHDTKESDSIDVSHLDAALTINVKDARFVGKLLGVPDLDGDPEAQLNISSSADRISLDGSVDADSIAYSKDSLQIHGSQFNAKFNLSTDSKVSVWDSGKWSLDASFRALDINRTHIASKILRVNYTAAGQPINDSLSITALCQIDSLAEFYVDASAKVGKDSIDLTANTLVGKLYGASLSSSEPVHFSYSPEVFAISPSIFLAGIDGSVSTGNSQVSVQGGYSFESGPDLQFKFDKVPLASLQAIARLDTNSLKLDGNVNGDASLSESPSGVIASIGFNGEDIHYNGSKSRIMNGNVKIFGNYMELSARLSRPSDSSWYTLRIDGTVPLSDSSAKKMELKIVTDSLNISFLTPFLPGVGDLEGTVSGDMTVSGKYSLPEFNGELKVSHGKIVKLAANQITYPFTGTIDGRSDKLVLNPVTIENTTGQAGSTMMARGSLEIRNNTIADFDVDLDGSLLVLNSTSRKSDQGMYGTAIAGSGVSGLKLKGSLAKPVLEGSAVIQSTTLTLMPLQAKQTNQVQEVVYRFPLDTTSANAIKTPRAAESSGKEVESGGFVDSLRYDLNVDTKDNVNLRMIFDPTTNEELDAILGGRLHLSNLSGNMELTGDVNILTGSSYNFYNKKFDATGKLMFTGDPLNPVLDITGIYQGQHTDTSNTGKTQTVVVKLRITGTFNQPNVDISLTVDNIPKTLDQQTNAVSFILTGQFEDELTTAQKQSVANNLWSQTGAGVIGSVGSSVLSGYLTNLLGKEFDFIQSVGLEYNSSSSITDPNVQITSRIGKGTIKVQTPIITTDINSTGFNFNYPLALLFSDMIYLEASRNVAVSNRTLGQRETTDMLRLFYQISF